MPDIYGAEAVPPAPTSSSQRPLRQTASGRERTQAARTLAGGLSATSATRVRYFTRARPVAGTNRGRRPLKLHGESRTKWRMHLGLVRPSGSPAGAIGSRRRSAGHAVERRSAPPSRTSPPGRGPRSRARSSVGEVARAASSDADADAPARGLGAGGGPPGANVDRGVGELGPARRWSPRSRRPAAPSAQARVIPALERRRGPGTSPDRRPRAGGAATAASGTLQSTNSLRNGPASGRGRPRPLLDAAASSAARVCSGGVASVEPPEPVLAHAARGRPATASAQQRPGSRCRCRWTARARAGCPALASRMRQHEGRAGRRRRPSSPT